MWLSTSPRTPPRSWFRQESSGLDLKPGSILRSVPHGEKKVDWEIIQIVEQQDRQRAENHSCPSYASIKMRCVDTSDSSKQVLVKYFIQIPWVNTELQDSTTRANQATVFTPREYVALKTLSENPETSESVPKIIEYTKTQQRIHPDSPVPGGFLDCLVWEVVPGIRLGDSSGKAHAFWKLKWDERQLIREVFQQNFEKMSNTGIWPDFASPGNLVWHLETKTLFWVGFDEEWHEAPPRRWNKYRLPYFDLIRPIKQIQWASPTWDGDTSEDKWYW